MAAFLNGVGVDTNLCNLGALDMDVAMNIPIILRPYHVVLSSNFATSSCRIEH